MNRKVLVDRSLLEMSKQAMLAQEAEIARLTGHSQELNRVYWRLALALGWVDEEVGKIDCDPGELMHEVEEQLYRIRNLDES